jgi:hypothetical protein
MSVASIIDPNTGLILPEYLPATHSSVQTVSAGNGITITGTTLNPIVSTNLAGGSGIAITGTTTQTIANTGVLSVGVGAGITNSGTATAPVIANTGVLSVSAGTAITVSGTASAPVINNNGVQSVSAGTGITIGGTANVPVINAVSLAPSLIVPYLGPAISQTTTGSINAFAGTTQAVADNEYWLITGSYAMASTANDATKTMDILIKCNVAGLLLSLAVAPESIAGDIGVFSIVLRVPPGNSSFALYVSGGLGGLSGTASASLSMLTYTKLA